MYAKPTLLEDQFIDMKFINQREALPSLIGFGNKPSCISL